MPFELMAWCKRWSTPRRIESTLGLDVRDVVAGDMHTALLTDDGQLMLCGSGNVVPPYISAETLQKFRDDEDDNEIDLTNSDSNVKAKAPNEEQMKDILENSVVVATPRRPSASWLVALTNRRTIHIAGSGSLLFALQDEELVSHSLTNPLMNLVIHGRAGDESSVASSKRYDSDNIGSYFEKRGKADCLIIAGGKVFLAHRAILCQRSSELRELIEAELPSDGDNSQPVQILLPQVQPDSAKALLHFLYTDVLPFDVVTNVTLLHSLVKVGEYLRIVSNKFMFRVVDVFSLVYLGCFVRLLIC